MRLSAVSGVAVTVDFETVDGTAKAGSDYTAASGRLTFTAGETAKTISVATLEDTAREAEEGFTVVLSNPEGASLEDDTGEGTITDDDEPPELAIDDAPPVAEGGTAEFVVRLSAVSGLAVTVDFETVDGTAKAGSDYTAASGRLTFTAGETAKTISVATLEDTAREAEEGFTVVLSNPEGASLEDDTGEGTITDDDQPPELAIDDRRRAAGGRRGTAGVERLGGETSRQPGGAFERGERLGGTVDFETVDGTAKAGSDYTAASGRLTFTAGETAKTISVATLEDTAREAEEGFTVVLSNPSGASLDDDTGAGTITDDDEPPGVAIDDAPAVVEGGTAEFVVRLSAVSGLAVTVDFETVDGTAKAGSDYTAASGRLTFTAGETAKTISVATLEDTAREAEEGFTVVLSNPEGASLEDDTGEGTITDDDEPPGVAIDDAPAVVEGGTAEFPVRLSAVSGLAVTVDFETVDGTAKAGSDYTAASGRLTFTAGELVQTISVATLDDTVPEAEEGFTVVLSNPEGASLEDDTGEGTITDDDEPPGVAIDDAPAVVEGGTAEFPVRLSAVSGLAVTVDFETVDGTAKAGSDYTAASGRLTFTAGELVQTISVATLDDTVPEAEEGFTVVLSNPEGASLDDDTGEGTITDDDELPGVAIDDAPAVVEGGTAEFPVRLSAVSGRVVTVSYRTVDGTALAGSDYTAASGTLSFRPGETSGAITVATLADELVEGSEQFRVELSDPVGTTLDDDTGVGTITDDAERRIGLVNRTVLPEIGRALAFSAVRCRMDQVISGVSPQGAEEPIIHLSPYLVPTSSGWTRTGGEPLPLEQVLGDPSFLIPSREDDDGGGRFAAWGCGDYSNLSGGGREGAVNWNGGVLGVHVGADVKLGSNLLAGLSISRSTGVFDYYASGADVGGGAYDLGMTGVHPYLAWSASPDLDIWATVGHARGEIRITDDVVGDPRTSGAILDSGLIGVSGRLLTYESTSLRLKGEAALARLDAAGDGGLFEAMTTGLSRLRLSTEASHDYRFSGGGSLTPWGELGVRHDGGDGETGAGLEVGGGLRYRNPAAGWSTEGYGRWLAVHEGARKEWGFGARIRYAPRSADYGPSVSVAPSWGDTTSGMQRLWEISSADPDMLGAPGTRLDTQFGYGFAAFRGRGVLTPYGAVGVARGQGQRYRLGGRMAVGRLGNLSLETERRVRAAARVIHAIRVRAAIRF